MQKTVVIVGAGAGGMTAATQVKKQCPDCRVIVFEKGDYVSWAGCPMPYYLSGKLTWKSVVYYEPDYFINDRKIEVYTRHEATGFDPSAKTVSVRGNTLNGDVRYDELVVGAGAKAVLPEIDGLDNGNFPKGVFTLRSPYDAKSIREYVEAERPARAVIVGGGLIGLEMSETFTELGMKTTVVEAMPKILPFLEGSQQRKRIDMTMARHEITLLTSLSVTAVSTAGGKIKSAILSDGSELPADILLLSAGIRPDLSLFEAAGVAPEGGKLIAGEQMQTHVPNVHALGDVVWTKHRLSGKPVYAPFGDVANKQGVVLGSALTGTPLVFKGVYGSASTSFFDFQIAKTGWTATEAAAEGYSADTVEVRSMHRVAGFEGTEPGLVRAVYDTRSGRVLGATIVTTNGASQFIDLFAVAVGNGLTFENLFDVDYAYSPTTAVVWNPPLAAYRKIYNR